MPFHRDVSHLLLGLAVVSAATRGGTPERIVAAMLLAATILTPIAQTTGLMPFASVDWGIAAVDTGLLMGLGAVALFTTRFWPMPAAALHGASLLTHFAAGLTPQATAHAYATAEIAPSFIIPVIVIVATWQHQRRRRRFGWDPAWVRDLPAEYVKGADACGIRDEPRGRP